MGRVLLLLDGSSKYGALTRGYEMVTTLQAVTDATFDDQVVQADRPVLVDFWAEWCPPCLALNPVLEDIARDYADKLTILKLDVDANNRTTMRYGVMSFPTLILFKGGEPVKQLVGARPKRALLRDLTQHLV